MTKDQILQEIADQNDLGEEHYAIEGLGGFYIFVGLANDEPDDEEEQA
jgi:hypothetical protein